MLGSKSGSSVSLLQAFAFPASGETLAKWPASDGEGFTVDHSGSARVLCAWAPSGTVAAGSAGLEVQGVVNARAGSLQEPMGGLHLEKRWAWGVDATRLIYNDQSYFESDQPAIFFAKTQEEENNYARLVTQSPSTVTLYHPAQVDSVQLDGIAQDKSAWNWSGGLLTVTLPALPSGGLLSTDGSGPGLTDKASSRNWLLYR